MPIRPPFELIPSLAGGSKTTSPLAALATGGADLVTAFAQKKAQERAQAQEALKTILTNFSLRPEAPGGDADGVPVKTLFGGLTGGRQQGLPQEFAGLMGTPKTDISALARIIPSLIANQPPGKEKPVGEIVKPGAIPGLQPEATVTPQPKGRGAGGPNIDSIFSQSSNAARATISQRIQQALADPKSANVKEFPILDSEISRNEYLKELRREAEVRGAPKEELEARIKKIETSMGEEKKQFQKDLKEGMAAVTRGVITKEEATRRLLRAYPLYRGDLLNIKELK